MSDFNLPLGCRSSDIPGNRPQDVLFEQWLDKVLALDVNNRVDIGDSTLFDFFEQGLSPEETIKEIYV